MTTMMVGGIAALLLQMLHPAVLADVWDHSNFRADTGACAALRGLSRSGDIPRIPASWNATQNHKTDGEPTLAKWNLHRMTRYFLHLHNDIDAPDEEGQEFPDDRSALECALRCARDIASTSVREGHLDLNHFIVCVAEDGREVGIVRFDDAVRVTALHGH